MRSLSGPIELSPNTDERHALANPLCDRPSSISDVSAWFSMSMNPGATARPVASTSCRPRALVRRTARDDAIAWIARSSTTPGAPVPS